MLRVSDGSWNVQNFIRCTQTTLQSAQDPIFLTGQVITQANDPADADVNLATAIVENIVKFQEGSTQIIEIIINPETTTGTFVNGATVTGISNVDEDVTIGVTVSQGLETATITNDGGTLTVGDEAVLTGGGGSGARVQVLDISGAGVDEVIVNAVGQNYQEGDTLTFSSGTAQAKVAVVNGGIAPETGNLSIHVELETGTITGGGSGDLLFETTGSNTTSKFLDSSSLMNDTDIRIELENEVGHLLSQEDEGTQTSERFYILNQNSEPERSVGMEIEDHVVLENETQNDGLYVGDKIVQENSTGSGDITDIRMISSGSGYTTLPTATIDGVRFLSLEDNTSNVSAPYSRIEFENGGRVLNESTFAVLNVTGGTVIPFGDDIGKATSLSIIEHGIDFTSAPTLAFPHYAVLKTVSGTISADETFTSNVSGATGTVIDFTAPLLKFTATTSELVEGDTITTSGSQTAIVAKADAMSGTVTINSGITTAGSYVNQDGHISEGSKKIQDSLYYQDFSYVIKVASSINKWRDALKRAVHPSGFYVTGEVNIQTILAGGVKQPVGATLSQGLFSGTSDSPIYMRLNTLFNTIFHRRTGVGLKFMSNGIELDGKTLVSTATARTGKPVEVHNDYRDTSTNTEKELNLYPETRIDTERRSRTNFYANTSYQVRGYDVSNGFAYAGPRLKTLDRFAFSAFSANNAITQEGGTGAGEIILENEHGVLQNDGSESFSTRLNSWTNLRFGHTQTGRDKILQEDDSNLINETAGTDTSDGVDEFLQESNVDGTTIRISDFSGNTSNPNHRINFAFPTEVTKQHS